MMGQTVGIRHLSPPTGLFEGFHDRGEIAGMRPKHNRHSGQGRLNDTVSARAFDQAAADKHNRRGRVKRGQFAQAVEQEDFDGGIARRLAPLGIAQAGFSQQGFNLAKTLRMARSDQQQQCRDMGPELATAFEKDLFFSTVGTGGNQNGTASQTTLVKNIFAFVALLELTINFEIAADKNAFMWHPSGS